MDVRGPLRAVALFEAAKGVLVLLTGFGLWRLVHGDAQQAAERLVAHLHLNPASRVPRIFLDLAANYSTRLGLLAALATAYAVVRFIEAYGLWRTRRWAEWFAALSAGIYVPFEIYELFGRDRGLAVGALVINVAILAMMVRALRAGGNEARGIKARIGKST